MGQWLAWGLTLVALALVAAEAAEAAELEGPELDVMYLRYKQQSIDTSPVFQRQHVDYHATLDFKMDFFAVEATPLGKAIITNVFLCPDADCAHETPRAIADFSRRVSLEPGEQTLYKFDVELHGKAQTYSITIRRLTGEETQLRRLIVQGSALVPSFKPSIRHYRCQLEVTLEYGLLEAHLEDSGQTILAEAEVPILVKNFSDAKWEKEELLGVPMRRLGEEPYGEFQYPKKYLEFPVPMGSQRKIRFKVISADGGHFGYYQLDLARQTCGTELPLFDVRQSRCVRFCNLGYWADFQQRRCKRCPDLCVSCISSEECLSCRHPTIDMLYTLDSTGQCVASVRPFWQKNAEQAVSIALSASALLIFLCGLVSFGLVRAKARRLAAESRAESRGARGPERGTGGPRGYRSLPNEDLDF
ncbi:unnamed protein product [Durusdinium trenchii]